MSLEFIELHGSKNINPGKNETRGDCIARLTHLYMNGKRIEKIGDLSACANLKVLYLHNNHIQTITNLGKLSQLTHLYLQWNRIGRLEGLDDLCRLRKLYAGNNRLLALTNLSGMRELEELHIERQQFPRDNWTFEFDRRSIDAVADTLRLLNISSLQLSSIEALRGLRCLETLVATDNQFLCADNLGRTLAAMPSVRSVDFRRCPAQRKDIYYRDKLVAAATNRLDSIDGKPITDETRRFVKRLAKNVRTRVEQLTRAALRQHKSLENGHDDVGDEQRPDSATDTAPANAEIISFRSWNSLSATSAYKKVSTQQQQQKRTPARHEIAASAAPPAQILCNKINLKH